MKYLQNLVKIPDLDPVSLFQYHCIITHHYLPLPPTPPSLSLSLSLLKEPPSFLLPGQLIEIELAKQVKLQAVQPEEESLVITAAATPNDSVFDSTFGRSGFSEGFDFPAEPPKKDERSVRK